MKEKNKKNEKAENIKNMNEIKSHDDFSWGGNTLQWQEESLDVASRHKSFKGEKKYTLDNDSSEEKEKK